MFKLKKKQLFFPVVAVISVVVMVFFISYSLSQTANRAVLDISLSSDNYESSTKTFADRSGLGNDGVSLNGVTFVGGKYGSVDGAMNFNGDGSNDHVFINKSMDITDTYTVSAWVKPDFSNPNSDHIIYGFSVISNDGSYYPLWVTIKIDGSVAVRSWTNNSSGHQTSSGLITENNWHHITVSTVKGGETRIYVDGKLKDVYNNTGYGTWKSKFYIGELRNGRNLGFDGLIDHVGLYNYVLSDDEVENLYDSERSVMSLSSLASDGLIGHWRLEKGYDREGVQNFACNPFTYYSTYHTLTQEGTTLIFTMKDSAPYLVARDASLGAMHGRTFAYSGYMKKNGVPYVPPSNRINTYNTASDILYYQADPTTGYFEAVMYFSHETTTWHFHWPITKETGDVITIENFQLEESDHVTEYAECSSPSKVSDSTPNSNHGTIFGATFTEDRFGKEGGAMRFDGSGTNDGVIFGNHIVVPENITDTRNCPDGCTYSLWLNVDTDAVDRMSLFRGASTLRHIEIYSSGKKFRTEAGLQNGYSFGTGNFPDNVRGDWAHFVIVFANNESGRPVRWYQNGKLFHTGYMTNGTYPDTEYFSFGSIGRSTGSTSYNYAPSFDGSIDDVRIYNRALSESEIQSLYDSYNPKTTTGTLQQGLVLDMPLKLKYTKDETPGSEIMTDRTPYSNDGQNYGATITSDGASFNGTSNYYIRNLDNILLNNDQTYSAWIRIGSIDGGLKGVLTTHNHAQTANLGINIINNKFYISIGYVDGTREYNSKGSYSDININEWTHIALIYNKYENSVSFYINGIFDNKWVLTKEVKFIPDKVLIGMWSNTYLSAYRYNGEISNVLIYNRALSDEEIKILYNRDRFDAGIIFQSEN